MTDVLGRIDNVLAGDRCPCGADPAPGSAYCSYDCTPTHVAGDTDPSGPGEYGAQSTPMRWRPDLVSEHDDSRLTVATRFRRGRYTATVYEINGADGVHCRLDDGNRYVGLDADTYQFISEQGLEPVWQRLERELGNGQHLEPDVDPWADAWGSGARFAVSAPTGWSGGDPIADMRAFRASFDPAAMGRAMESMQLAVQNLTAAFRRAQPALARLAAATTSPPETEPAHPMLAAIKARRNRNTGPGQRPRAPRQINPRRGR